jgi:hypothetical protein
MEVDAESALMTVAEFNELPEYSMSLPTGTTIGKRWRRHCWGVEQKNAPLHRQVWMLGEYAASKEPATRLAPDGFVDIIWRRILLADYPTKRTLQRRRVRQPSP